jgi:hypothetical protein
MTGEGKKTIISRNDVTLKRGEEKSYGYGELNPTTRRMFIRDGIYQLEMRFRLNSWPYSLIPRYYGDPKELNLEEIPENCRPPQS